MHLSVRTGSLLALVWVIGGCHDAPVAAKITPPDSQPVTPALFRVIHLRPHISDYATWMGIQLLAQGSGYQVVGADFDVDWHRFASAQCSGTCGLPSSWQVSIPDSAPSCCGTNMGAVLMGTLSVSMTEGWDSGYEYRACAGACGTAGAWSRSTISVSGSLGSFYGHSHPLAIDSTGTLHLLSRAHAFGQGALRYSECGASCGDSSSWQTIVLDSSGRVLDAAIATIPAGGVGIATTDSSGALRYRSCVGSCMDAANWSSVTIDSAKGTQKPSLIVGSDGKPRMTYEVSGTCIVNVTSCGGNGPCNEFFVTCATHYAFCVSACTTPGGWRTVTVALFGGIDASLALDSDRHPWIAISGLVGTLSGARTSYQYRGSVLLVHCLSGCANPSNWIQTPIDSLGGSAWISLAMDASNHPHIAVSGYGIDYAELKDSSISLVSSYRKTR